MPVRRERSIGSDLLLGAIAGVVATAAMTVCMDAIFRRLPEQDRYPLPPRELTEAAAKSADVREELDETDLVTASLASHFGFGAVTGGLYGPLLLRRPFPVASGTGYGLLVWLASYLGWVPGAGLLRPATEHPARRNGLMIAAHIVWGSTLGLVAYRLAGAVRPFSAGPLRDR